MTGKAAIVQRDTGIHVAQFLQEPVGATRQVRVVLDRLPLGDDLVAHDLVADLRLTRIPSGILVKGPVAASVTLQCIRCLEEFAQPIAVEVADEYRPTVDVLTGVEVPASDEADDEWFGISGLHVLDVAESLRQALVLAIPMAPLCREDCPGLPEVADLLNEGDARLAVLGQLLNDDDAGAPATTGRGKRRPRAR